MRYIYLSLVIFSFTSLKASSIEHYTSHSQSPLLDTFESIYKNAYWGKDANGNGTSGPGSEARYCRPYLYYLRDFIEDHQISSIIDVGCGDWQSTCFIDLDKINYIGIDASKTVIENNKKKYEKDNIRFIHGDFLEYENLSGDLLICKDVLMHLSFKNILKFLSMTSRFKYTLITNDVDRYTLTCQNKDIVNGDFRHLDLTQYPFFIKGSKVLTYLASNEAKTVLLIKN